MQNLHKNASKLFILLFLALFSSNAESQEKLHLIHWGDAEASVPALETAPNFAALVDKFIEQGNSLSFTNLILSSGDNYLPGPFMSAAGDRSMRDIFRNVTGNSDAREGNGRADILIHNILGVEASVIGNHEFDFGTDFLGDIMNGDLRPGDARYRGADFPYLSANLDFSQDGNLSGLFTDEIRLNTEFKTTDFNNPVDKKIAPSTIIEKNGVKYGVVGATTPIVESIASTGDVFAKAPGGGSNNMQDLVTILQPYVDSLTNEGCDIIILLSHMQQLSLERELIGYLNDVDIVIAGGSNSILADDNDELFAGDTKLDDYPVVTETMNGDPALIVNTDGGYKYVGRLYVEFNNGILDTSSIDDEISGAWKADSNKVKEFYQNYMDAFSNTMSRAYKVKTLTDGLENVIAEKDGNTFGYTKVFLEGRRAKVRTQETNLGNLTADANLWYAKSIDNSVQVSLKNGGGIRNEIGNIITTGTDNFNLVPPVANPLAGKEFGEISQLDIENSMRFNNGLSLLTLTATQLLEVLNHAVDASAPGETPGQFAQVSGVRYFYDTTEVSGSKIRDAWIIDSDGNDIERLATNGVVSGDPDRAIRIVTLNFLAGGGDSYPYDQYEQQDPQFVNRVDLAQGQTSGSATFTEDGSEQDALAEYLAEFHSSQENGFNSIREHRINLITPTTLHLLHWADAESSVPQLETAPNFAALVDKFVEQGDDLGLNTFILSSGDNYLPGPFLSAAGDRSMRNVFRTVTGNESMREGNGRADIEIHNILGVEASAIGNHEFDLGTNFFGDVIANDIRDGGEARYLGTQFPYVSANLDFSQDGNLSGLFTDELLQNTQFESRLANLENASDKKIAPYTIITKEDGTTIGVVGATTPIVENISSTGDVTAKNPGGRTNNMGELAQVIQPYVDSLLAKGINKIVVLAHMQQLSLERSLIDSLRGVDIIIAGGSNSILADTTDTLKAGDFAVDTYPIVKTNKDGDPALIVNTDGGFNYVGRLLVNFDKNGVLDTNSINDAISGAWKVDSAEVIEQFGDYASAFQDQNSRAYKVKQITDGLTNVIASKDGNTFGFTDVFLEGRREKVRTEETNLGNLTADANLWYAKKTDASVQVSLKNGGGIRAEIGNIQATGTDNYELVPPIANPIAGKENGEISQLDIENSMRFNNGLTLFSLTAEQLLEVLEHGVAASGSGETPGQFAQVAGVRFTYDTTQAAGSRIIDAWIIDEIGNDVDQIAEDGEVVGDASREIRVVSLGFLVGGGDSYPYPTFKEDDEAFFNEVDLESDNSTGSATFTSDGTEQDALAEYLNEFHSTRRTAFNKGKEGRIVHKKDGTTLHLLHLADAEASVPALETAPNFAALVDKFVEQGDDLGLQTFILSSGDNYLPGPFMSAAGDRSMRDVFRKASGNPFMREGTGRADIEIHNILGIEASAIGNHEFDLGTNFFEGLIATDIRSGGEARYFGANFPYLSANLDFSKDDNLSGLVANEVLLNKNYANGFRNIDTEFDKQIAPSTIIRKGDGTQIGIVGATTPVVEDLSSTGSVVAKDPGGGTNNMQQLAQILQPEIDKLIEKGIDKIIVLSHMQQLALERELIGELSGVDIIIAGGSNSILADDNDELFAGDEEVDTYPIVTENGDGDPALIVNTDGGYKYVGRLLVEFDGDGVIQPSTINDEISGAWRADEETVKDVYGDYETAFADTNSRAYKVKTITDGLSDVIATKDGNTFGWTDVFLEGRRSEVRTRETNLGNLTADANLWYARRVDSDVRVSLKNGGGIRAEIGNIQASGTGDYELVPPIANPLADKESGEISQLDIENSLRFNNGLSIITLSADQLFFVLNHAVSSSEPGATPGQFAQVGGIRFTWDAGKEPGSRVKDAYFIDQNGIIEDTLAKDFRVVGNVFRPIRVVTLGFLADGGDSYPYDIFSEADPDFFNRVDLEADTKTGSAMFASDGTEQDALAEYLQARHGSKEDAFDKGNEGRIVRKAPYTLHLLHHADAEASVPALETAPLFAALVDAYVDQGEELGLETLILSSGDNYLPGPFMSAAGDRSMREVFRDVSGNPDMREGNGRADIEIQNILGVEASAIGNHEFDLGTNFFADLIAEDIRDGGEGRYLGTNFPYLSANLDFSQDGNLADLYTDEILPREYFETNLSSLDVPEKRIAPATIITKEDGTRFGIVGATTPIVASISSTGDVTVKQPGGGTNNMQALAEILQPEINRLRAKGIDKIIVLSHMQQLSLERELIGYLEGVDIIIAGGSNSILADDNDELFPGDEAVDTYPIISENANGEPALILNTDGGYKYVGRLLVEFDSQGVIDPETINSAISGAQIANSANVASIFGGTIVAFETEGSRAQRVKKLVDGLESVIAEKDGNTFGWTDVFLEGRRSEVRTRETNLGNLTADANLWYAQQSDPTVQVSLKNGGGIRAEIGVIKATGVDEYELLPPAANPIAGKEEGEISQLDIENSLRFNNDLTIFTLTAEQLAEVLEHAVAGSGNGNTPGQFAQVGGVRFTYDVTRPAGERIIDAFLETDGQPEQFVSNGEVTGDPNREIRCVSLGFLVGGGDSYPYPSFETADPDRFNKVELEAEESTGNATFAPDGTEQDALAEYLANIHGTQAEAFNGQPEGRIQNIGQSDVLHLIHLADAEASVEATNTAPNFAALVDAFVAQGNQLGVTTLVLSSGDNYLPGPFMSGAGDRFMREIFRSATGNPFMREGNGRGDIEIHNILGIEASAIGNHEFDLGTNFFADVINSDIRDGGDARYLGAQFPYLSANLDFSEDGNLSGLFTEQILNNNEFRTTLEDLDNPAPFSIAPATIIEKDGLRFGIIGATTPIVESISSTGDVEAKNPGSGTNNMEELASILQPYIDQFTAQGINKIILLAHMQQLSLERELIGFLNDVDIVIAGGSNSILADENDRLLPGDEAVDTYPIVTTNAEGDPALIVNTDGGYRYVGRLLVEFDSEGKIIEGSVNDQVSGAWATDDMMVETLFGSVESAFADQTSRANKVKQIADGIQQVIIDKDGNTFGWTDVFLEGRRSEVRTRETNLGNLTAEANLWYAKQEDETVQVSLKNGGGIRAEIGAIVATGVDNYEERPPLANPLAGKQEGEISQLDIENSLRFNNDLTLFTLTAEQLVETIEHAISASEPGATPGQFPQIAGMRFEWDWTLPAGERVISAWLVDDTGEIFETLVGNGELVGDASRPIRCVSLGFLVGGGDSYPYPDFQAADENFFNQVDLEDENSFTGNARFAPDGTEQDALAEYLFEFYGSQNNAFDLGRDNRILNVAVNSVKSKDLDKIDLIAYPNPAKDLVNFRFELETPQNVTITITNALGQVISTKDLGSINGTIDHQINFGNYINGRYYVNVKSNDINATAVITISK